MRRRSGRWKCYRRQLDVLGGVPWYLSPPWGPHKTDHKPLLKGVDTWRNIGRVVQSNRSRPSRGQAAELCYLVEEGNEGSWRS